MCGRLNIIDDPISQFLDQVFGLKAAIKTNLNLCPSQELSCLVADRGQTCLSELSWGIQPTWAKRLLINARAEHVEQKKTFSAAYRYRRCLVPCMGWYEWHDRRKYSFTAKDARPFLMAGLWFEAAISPANDLWSPLESGPAIGKRMVTLTRTPLGPCTEIHERMPLTIPLEQAGLWLHGRAPEVSVLLQAEEVSRIAIAAA